MSAFTVSIEVPASAMTQWGISIKIKQIDQWSKIGSRNKLTHICQLIFLKEKAIQ